MLDAMATSQPRRVSLSLTRFLVRTPLDQGQPCHHWWRPPASLEGEQPRTAAAQFRSDTMQHELHSVCPCSGKAMSRKPDQKALSRGISCHLSLDAFSGDTASKRAAAVTARNWLLWSHVLHSIVLVAESCEISSVFSPRVCWPFRRPAGATGFPAWVR